MKKHCPIKDRTLGRLLPNPYVWNEYIILFIHWRKISLCSMAKNFFFYHWSKCLSWRSVRINPRERTLFKSKSTEWTYAITKFIPCHTAFMTYMLRCPCSQYVGCTGNCHWGYWSTLIPLKMFSQNTWCQHICRICIIKIQRVSNVMVLISCKNAGERDL